MNLESVDTIAAALAAIFGGIGVKVLEKLLNKRSEQFLEDSKFREELRLSRDTAHSEAIEYRQEADAWRDKYYQQVEETMAVTQTLDQLKLEHQKLLLDSSDSPKTDS